MGRRAAICVLALILAALAYTPAHAGVTRVSDACSGSSNPTFYPNNRRSAVTARNRWLVVYDVHGVGQQLAWRDPGRRWRTRTRGNVDDGFFRDDRLGDRPASIALARDRRGRQHAWVVWSGYEFAEYPLQVQVRRLTGLNSPRGPRVGRAVTVMGVNRGNARVDLAFERPRRGAPRGVISWLRRAGRNRYQLVVRWFTNLRRDAPRFHHGTVVYTGRDPALTATLVPRRSGMRIVARSPSGKLRVFKHRIGAPLRRWVPGRAGVSVGRFARPSAVGIGRRYIMAAVETNRRRHVVKVVRFTNDGRRARVVLRRRGYEEPTIASRGRRAWLVMLRRRDGFVVSRTLRPGSGWTRRDRVEIGAQGGGDYAWPNLLRSVGRSLRFVVDGPRCPTSRNANTVLAYQRRI